MINIGLVGCGRILAAHLRGYRLLRDAGYDDFRIVALCARKEHDAWQYVQRGKGPAQRAAVSRIPGDPLAIADEYISDFQDASGVRVFTDFTQMMADTAIDAVNDYTTHGLHHEVAAAAFAQRKHLLSQKPLGVTVEAARRMCDHAAAVGVTFGVFENARYRPAVQHARWAFGAGQGGPAGRPQMALLGNIGTWWAPDHVVAGTPWRHRKILGGGLAIDLGVHQFHVVRSICGPIREVQGSVSVMEPRRYLRDEQRRVLETVECDADDTFFASFHGEGGVTGTLFASFAGQGVKTVLGEGAVYYGTKGRITGDQFHRAGESTPESLAALYVAQASDAEKSASFPRSIDDQFALAQHFWLQAIRDGAQPTLDGHEGLMDLACAYAVLESHTAGRRVTIDEVLSGRLDTYQQPINRHFGLI